MDFDIGEKLLINVKQVGENDYTWHMIQKFQNHMPGAHVKDCIRLVKIKGQITGIAIKLDDQFYSYDKFISKDRLIQIMLKIG